MRHCARHTTCMGFGFMSTRIGIIDYGIGNLTSVRNAFAAIGCEVHILDEPSGLCEVSHIVLPGVGAFGDGISSLRDRNWIPIMEEEVRQKRKPFLGICLGLQLLATRGTEHGLNDGLDWITGEVVRLSDQQGTLHIPHIGWNDALPARRNACYREGFDKPGVFYFAHSYHLVPREKSVVDGWCKYGDKFVASVSQDNIWAVQFHPEKSQKAGLQVLHNFVAFNP